MPSLPKRKKPRNTGPKSGFGDVIGGIIATPVRPDLHEALLDKIGAKLKEDLSPAEILELAEAYAWVHSPDQPHGDD